MTRSDGPPLLLVGTDFRLAPLELRERVALSPRETEELLVALLARPAIGEAFALSTCNRTEVYLAPRDEGDEETAYRELLDLLFLARAPELGQPGRLYVQRNREAAHHLLAVASGLESMVLGEPEILGQVKVAAGIAEQVGSGGPVIQHLLRAAIEAGGRARRETGIASGAVSLGYATVELAKNIFRDLEQCRILMLGAGETAKLVARNLLERGARKLTVANRTAERLEELRQELPTIEVLPFDQRVAALAAADLIVVATGAEEPVLTRHDLMATMEVRGSRPLLVVDLGVPRNVDPDAAKIGNLFLHTIDSLQHLIERNLKRRREEVPKVEELLGRELDRFFSWYKSLDAEPIVAELQRQAEEIRRRELAAAYARFPPETHGDLDRLTRSLVKKILHHPSARLRDAEGENTAARLAIARDLFRLDSRPEPPDGTEE
ncbi:MAG TPA: glutamyl-tRNA reductase [Thermoanaerobaculia bacterium]|nr:glutamyl-tRNA reductase [Thermoanaerobaculia bacterium]